MLRVIRLCIFSVVAMTVFTGCLSLPELSHQPTVHNPFPQLTRIAVAPFFNLSQDPTVNGRTVAVHYFNELQSVPGFEVVPVGVVETYIASHGIQLSDPESIRQLAILLKVDAVVIGVITDFTPYYPPKMGLQVQWFAANPGFHPIPPGYGLPWGNEKEANIPQELLLEAEMALAREQMATQTPQFSEEEELQRGRPLQPQRQQTIPASPEGSTESDEGTRVGKIDNGVVRASMTAESADDVVKASAVSNDLSGPVRSLDDYCTTGQGQVGLPSDWPDPRGFISPPPRTTPAPLRRSNAPVISHTQIYNGADKEFTNALRDYYYYQDDARGGNWQAYLVRSDDFVRFCCHMHIWETLVARGGAGEARVVWRVPKPDKR